MVVVQVGSLLSITRNFLTESADHAVPTRGPRYHHQSPGGEHCNETGWGPEFFPNCEDPETPTEMNSPTRYETFASAHRSKPLQGSGHDTSPTLKPQGRRNARKSAQPSGKPQRSKKIQKKQSKGVKGDGNTSGTASGLPVTPGIQRGLQLFQEQLRLLERAEQEAVRGKAGRTV
jgi:hypothetical protein